MLGAVRVAVVPVLAVVAVISWWIDVPPVAAVVASGFAITRLLARWLPIDVCIAAAVPLVAGGYLVLLVALGLIGPRGPLSPVVAIVVLLVPAAGAWVADRLLGPPRHLGGSERGARLVLRGAIAPALVGTVVLGAVVVAAGVAHDFGELAWATAGDARNHVRQANRVRLAGGIDVEVLQGGPYLLNGLLALLADTRNRASMGVSRELLLDIRSAAALSALLASAWSVTNVALLRAFGVGVERHRLALATASVLPLLGVGLGVALRDGFLSTLLAVPVLLGALGLCTWVLKARPDARRSTLATLGISMSFPVLATTWTPLAAVAFAVAAPTAFGMLRRPELPRRAIFTTLAVGATAAVALAAPTLGGRRSGALTAPGSIEGPSPLTNVLLAVAVAAIAWRRGSGERSPFLPYAAGCVVALALVSYLVTLQPAHLAWNYYPEKLAWTWTLVGIPLLLLPAWKPTGATPTRRAAHLRAVGVPAVVVGAVAMSSPLASPVVPTAWAEHLPRGGGTRGGASIVDGWDNPTAAAVVNAVSIVSEAPDVAVFRMLEPDDDRMTNFWLAADDVNGETPLFAWAYAYPHVDPAELCPLLRDERALVVLTTDASLPAAVASACSVPTSRVRVRSTGP